MLFLLAFLMLLFSNDASAQDQNCEWTAPDYYNQNYLHSSFCVTTQEGTVTEVYLSNRAEIWQIDGTIGRQLSPGMVWRGSSWQRDYYRDKILWEGTAKKSAGPCKYKGPVGNGWDFSNGMRICLY
jgi:hypothetical protein